MRCRRRSPTDSITDSRIQTDLSASVRESVTKSVYGILEGRTWDEMPVRLKTDSITDSRIQTDLSALVRESVTKSVYYGSASLAQRKLISSVKKAGLYFRRLYVCRFSAGLSQVPPRISL
jgi:hypothetical protein